MIVEDFLTYIRVVKRYSPRTQDIYGAVLEDFRGFVGEGNGVEADDALLIDSLRPQLLRSYQVRLIDTGHSPRTVSQHISALSSFCRWLVMQGKLASNPARQLTRPKVERRLPHFYRAEALAEYFRSTEGVADAQALSELREALAQGDRKFACRLYDDRLRRLVVSLLAGTGVRRAELISLRTDSVDFGRKVLKVLGKGDKMRKIPLLGALCEEISLYLKAVELIGGRGSDEPGRRPLMVTHSGRVLYPAFVDRAVKRELGEHAAGITGRKSPHVLRHTLATGLLNNEADLNSIKELLGHSSLAATQVYTHTSVAQLKRIYQQSHPRAKSGGKNGD